MSEKAATQFQPPKSPPPHDGETRPLPDGWIKQFDTNSGAWFYVDTKSTPSRSIWTHPFDDPTFLDKHPQYKNYDHHDNDYDDAPPEYMRRPPSAPPSVPAARAPPVPSSSRPSAADTGKMPEKRSFFGKLKDKAIGTKEEREAARAEARRIREAERKQRLEYQRAIAAQYGAPPQMVYTTRPGYGYDQGYGPGPSYGNQTRYVYSQQPRRQGGFGGGGFGGGSAAPLLGGLAGGLLLGELIGGDGFGGDFGGDGGGFF